MSDDAVRLPGNGAAHAVGLEPRRVVIFGLTPMLTGLVRTLLATVPGAKVVSEIDDPELLAEAARTTAADVAVVGEESRVWWPALLHARPALTVLSINAASDVAEVVELRPVARRRGELSREVLAAAISDGDTWEQRFDV